MRGRIIEQTALTVPDDDPQKIMDQMWECSHCGDMRQWGTGPSPFPRRTPFLLCDVLGEHIEHKFAGLLDQRR